jgi:hypothetical protein
VVFLNSLKDTRPTAPKMSYSSGAGQLWPMRTLSRSENFNRTSLSDVVGRFCLYGSRLLNFFQPKADTVHSCASTTIGEQSRFYAQET